MAHHCNWIRFLTVKCNRRSYTKLHDVISVLKLQPECSVSEYYQTQSVLFLLNRCQNLPSKQCLPNLLPIRLNKLDPEELSIAQNQVDQYSEELNKMMNQLFVSRHTTWCTYFPITIQIILNSMYIWYKCWKRTNRINITAGPASSG